MESIITILEAAIQETSKMFIGDSGRTIHTTAAQRQEACKTIANTLGLPKRKRGELVADQIQRLAEQAKAWIFDNQNSTSIEQPLSEFYKTKRLLFSEIESRSLSWLMFHMFSIENTGSQHALKAIFHKQENGEWLSETESIDLLQSKNLAELDSLRLMFIDYARGYLYLENEVDGQYKICFRTARSTYTIRTHEEFIPIEQIVRSENTAPQVMFKTTTDIKKLKVVK